MKWQPHYTLPSEFTELPYQVYADDPNWLPESKRGVEKLFSPANGYFQHNSVWLSVEPGATRLAGFFDPKLRVDEQKTAFFGFWETVDSLEPNRKLFADFEQWAKSQGATVVYGPLNFATPFGNYRIRLDQFDKGCFPGEPYNPPYYQKLLEALGYRCRGEYFSYINYNLQRFVDDNKAMMESIRSNLASDFVFTSLTAESWLHHLETIHGHIDDIFGKNFAYSPINYESFLEFVGKPFAKRLCEKSSILVLDKAEKLAGFFIVFPDYAQLLRQGAPNRIPINEIDYQKHFSLLPQPTFGIAKAMGVLPEYRRFGRLFAAINFEVAERISKHYDYSVGATASKDSNTFKVAKRYEAEKRTYGLFYKSVISNQ